jgi:manganese-dependent inorganic pyrophosphatase
VATSLAERAGVDPDDLGTTILRLAADISDRSAEQLLPAAFKDFSVEGRLFGIGVIETPNGAEVLARRAELLAAMGRLGDRGYTSVLFAMIDLVHEQTTLLVVGHAASVTAANGAPLADAHTVALPGILSRKKHLVPLLTALSQRIAAS